jgi:Uma2 family endonuclease
MSKSLLDGPEPRPDDPDTIPDGPDYADVAFASLASLELVAEDGEPMESAWHRRCMNLLIDQIDHRLRDRDDFFVGGNMFIYFSTDQARNRDFRGPDFFYVNGCAWNPDRPYWAVWEEGGRTPNVVIELSSPTTRDEDHEEKFRICRDRLHVPDYFIYDRDTGQLEGWRLDGRRYRPLTLDESGRLWSAELELFVGPWQGEYGRLTTTWLRFFDSAGEVVPTPGEAAAERAEAEKHRADSAEAEVARLKAELARLQQAPENPS